MSLKNIRKFFVQFFIFSSSPHNDVELLKKEELDLDAKVKKKLFLDKLLAVLVFGSIKIWAN